jgi:Zn-dependent protease
MLLLSMVAHEFAHGYAALKQGDDTAKSLGRLTFNPLKHIDPFMTILLPVMTFIGSGGRMMFGGAKPVPVDPRNYRHYVRGDIIVSLAGVATNVAIAALLVPAVIILGMVARQVAVLADSVALLQIMLLYGVLINLVLAAFNLIPIPPLDGSHVIKHLMPRRMAYAYQRAGRYGLIILIGILYVDRRVIDLWMGPALSVNDWAVRLVSPWVELGRWGYLVSGT